MSRPFESLNNAASAISSGGVVLLPTDTLPGFHCRADNSESLARIFALKGRDEGKPLLVLAANQEQANLVTAKLNIQQEQICHKCWPGPFSLILPAADKLPVLLTAGGKTIAVRVPDVVWLRELLLEVGFPVASTSVNQTDKTPCRDLKSAVQLFGRAVDGYWVPDSLEAIFAQDAPKTQFSTRDVTPSALVDLVQWPPRVLRQGPEPLPNW